jgi:PAS domain S-box-containing protein
VLKSFREADKGTDNMVQLFYSKRFPLYTLLTGVFYSLWNLALLYQLVPAYALQNATGNATTSALNENLKLGLFFWVLSVVAILVPRFFKKLQAQAYWIFVIQLYVMTSHFFVSVQLSHLSVLFLVCTLILTFSSTQLLTTAGSAYSYLVYLMVCGLFVSGADATNPKLLLFAGQLTISLFSFLSIRNKSQAYNDFSNSSKKATQLLDAVPLPTWTMDANGECDYVNPEWAHLFGESETTGIRKRYLEIIHADDFEKESAEFKRSLASRTPHNSVIRCTERNGVCRSYIFNAHPRHSQTGEFIGYVGTLTDITDRLNVEQELRKSEDRTKMAVEAAGIRFWNLDLATEQVYGSAQFFELLGLPAASKPLLKHEAAKFLYSQDKDLISKKVGMLAIGEVSEDVEYRIVNSAGETRWLRSRATKNLSIDGSETISGTAIDITSKKDAELKSERASAELSLVSEAGSVRSWEVDLVSNTVTKKTLGSFGDDDSAVTLPLQEFYDTVHPDDLAALKNALDVAIRDRNDYQATFRFTDSSAGKGEQWALIRGRIYYDINGSAVKAIGITLDLTEIKKLSSDLAAKNEILSLTLKAAQIAYWEWNPSTNEYSYDAKWFESLGIAISESESPMQLMSSIHADDIPMMKGKIYDHLMGNSDVCEAVLRVKNGAGMFKYILVKGKVVERDKHGKALKFCGVNVNLTESIGLQRTIEEQSRQLADSAKLASIGVVASAVAHELNNSLNFINGGLKNLRKLIPHLSTEEQRTSGESMVSVMEAGMTIANSVVKGLSRSTPTVKSGLTEVNIREAVETAIELIKSRLDFAKVSVDIPSDLKVTGSTSGLNQVFMNLIINAADASAENNGSVSVSATIVTREGEECAEIKISDTGTGMPESVVERIFDPFFTTKAVGKGSGLGMFVVKSEIEKHKGKIEVHSIQGKGTTFTITIPSAPKVA